MKFSGSYALGLCFIFLVSIIWAAASIMVQYLYQNLDFDSPFLLTYICSSLFIVFIPMRLLWERRTYLCILLSRVTTVRLGFECTTNASDSQIIIPWTSNNVKRGTDPLDDWSSIPTDEDAILHMNINQLIQGQQTLTRSLSYKELERRSPANVEDGISLLDRSTSIDREDADAQIQPPSLHLNTESNRSSSPSCIGASSNCKQYLLSHEDHMKMAVKIAPLWFTSNYFYNLSLKYTTITSSTVLSSTGSVFTFMFSICCGDESFTKWKVLGVSVAFLGSILTALQDASAADDNYGEDLDDNYKYQLWGDAAGMIGAIGYGGYTVLVRVLLPSDENRMSMLLFLGYVGLFNMLVLSPFMVWDIADINGAGDQSHEKDNQSGDANYAHHLTWFIFGCILVKGLFDNVISDYLWARSIILTSATVATVGLGLTIPLALLSDVFIMRRGDDVLNTGSIFGAIFVFLGFIFVNIGEVGEAENDDRQSDSSFHSRDVDVIGVENNIQ